MYTTIKMIIFLVHTDFAHLHSLQYQKLYANAQVQILINLPEGSNPVLPCRSLGGFDSMRLRLTSQPLFIPISHRVCSGLYTLCIHVPKKRYLFESGSAWPHYLSQSSGHHHRRVCTHYLYFLATVICLTPQISILFFGLIPLSQTQLTHLRINYKYHDKAYIVYYLHPNHLYFNLFPKKSKYQAQLNMYSLSRSFHVTTTTIWCINS